MKRIPKIIILFILPFMLFACQKHQDKGIRIFVPQNQNEYIEYQIGGASNESVVGGQQQQQSGQSGGQGGQTSQQQDQPGQQQEQAQNQQGQCECCKRKKEGQDTQGKRNGNEDLITQQKEEESDKQGDSSGGESEEESNQGNQKQSSKKESMNEKEGDKEKSNSKDSKSDSKEGDKQSSQDDSKKQEGTYILEEFKIKDSDISNVFEYFYIRLQKDNMLSISYKETEKEPITIKSGYKIEDKKIVLDNMASLLLSDLEIKLEEKKIKIENKKHKVSITFMMAKQEEKNNE